MSKANLIETGVLVNDLRSALYEVGDESTISRIVSDLILDDRWREFIDPLDRNKKTYELFSDFCTKSLQCHPESLMDHVRHSPVLRGRIEQLAVRPRGKPPKKTQDVIDDNIIHYVPQKGTSQASGMRRLAKDRPDLAEKVAQGKVSVHAASVTAGFRRRTATVRLDSAVIAIRILLKHFTIDELRQALDEVDAE